MCYNNRQWQEIWVWLAKENAYIKVFLSWEYLHLLIVHFVKSISKAIILNYRPYSLPPTDKCWSGHMSVHCSLQHLCLFYSHTNEHIFIFKYVKSFCSHASSKMTFVSKWFLPQRKLIKWGKRPYYGIHQNIDPIIWNNE